MLEVWGKYHCVYVVIDLRYMLDLLWVYPIPNKLYLLSVLLDSTYSFSQLPAIGAQDLQLNNQGNHSVSRDIGISFIWFQKAPHLGV